MVLKKNGGVWPFANKKIKIYVNKNGLINEFFSPSTSISRKREVNIKINEKLISLMILYSNDRLTIHSSDITILVNNICEKNFNFFLNKIIQKKKFCNMHYINININKIYNNTEIKEYAINHFINIFYNFALKYVGYKSEIFKIHKRYYDILIKENKLFFNSIINFINERDSYLFNINFIIILIYTYTHTTLEYNNNNYFPNHYMIIYKCFLKYISNYGYPSINNDFYAILRNKNDNEINNLNTNPNFILKK